MVQAPVRALDADGVAVVSTGAVAFAIAAVVAEVRLMVVYPGLVPVTATVIACSGRHQQRTCEVWPPKVTWRSVVCCEVAGRRPAMRSRKQSLDH